MKRGCCCLVILKVELKCGRVRDELKHLKVNSMGFKRRISFGRTPTETARRKQGNGNVRVGPVESVNLLLNIQQ